MAQAKLAILVEAIGAAKAARELKGVDAAVSRIGAHTGSGLRSAASNLGKLGLIAGGVVVGGLVGAAKAAIDFEDAFAGVVKTVDEAELRAAGSSFAQLSDEIRKLARAGYGTHQELALIAENAGALGIKAKDIVSFTETVAMLAQTTDVTADQASTALGQLSNVLQLTGDEYDNFAAALVDLGNKGASTESQILEIASRAGAGANLIGVAKDATLGWSSAVANLGIETEAGGSALQKFFLETQGLVNTPKKLKVLAKVAGMTGKEFKQAFEKDASGALATLLKGLGKLDAASQLDVLEDLGFNDVRIQRMLLGLANNTDNLTNSLEVSREAWKEATAAQIEFEKRQKTVKSAITRLRTAITDAAITVGEGFAPAIGRAADKLAKFLDEADNREKLKKIGEDVGRFLDSIDWKAVIDGAKTFVGVLDRMSVVARAAWDVFSAMPTEVKTTLLALAGLNKLTGGAVSSIVGELGKGLIKGVLGMTAGVVNINAGVVNGGGLPGGGAPTGPAGAAAGGGLRGLLSGGLKLAGAAGLGFIVTDIFRSLSSETTKWASQEFGPAVGKQFDLQMDFARQLILGPFETVLDVLQGEQVKVFGPIQALVDVLRGPLPTKVNSGVLPKQPINYGQFDPRTGSPNVNIDPLVAEQRATRNVTAAGLAGVRASINAIRLNPRITIPVNVTSRVTVSTRSITTGQRTIARYGQIGHL